MCLKMSEKIIEQDKKAFCSMDCLVKFERKMKVDTEVLEMNEEYENKSNEKQELQVIDLSII